MRASRAQIEQFREDGLVIVPELLDAAGVGRALGAMARVYRGEYNADRRPPRVRRQLAALGGSDSVQWILNARVVDSDLWALATDVRLGELAATLLETNSVSIVEDQLLAKPPRGRPVNVHQDYSYWPFSRSTQLVTAWIALVDTHLGMGPVQLLRGSQRWGTTSRPNVLIDGSDEDWLQGLAGVVPTDQKLDLVSVEVPAGGGVFFHSLCFHGSPANRSDQWRRAISLHWAGADCRVNLAETARHDFPYFFARLTDGGPLSNHYMPVVYCAASDGSAGVGAAAQATSEPELVTGQAGSRAS